MYSSYVISHDMLSKDMSMRSMAENKGKKEKKCPRIKTQNDH